MPAPLAAPLVLGLLAKGVGTKAEQSGLNVGLQGPQEKLALAAASWYPYLFSRGLGGDPLAGAASAGRN